jgi:uncharacterized membrane protein
LKKLFVNGEAMYSELIVLISSGKEDSYKVWRDLERSQGGKLFDLIDIVLISRDKKGQVAFQMRLKQSEQSNDQHSRLAGDFAASIFGASAAENHPQLVERGLDPLFLQEVDQALEPGFQAFMIYVPQESQIDTRRYLEVLGRLQGDLYHTTFPVQVEEVLVNKENDH